MTVDPFNIPKLLNAEQLEWFILFGVCVAGKGAKQTQEKVNNLLADMALDLIKPKHPMPTPFQIVHYNIKRGKLRTYLKRHRIGQYNRIERAFKEAINLDLDNISIKALESVSGIGPKTARMVCMYAIPNTEVAVLDTHILKWLNSLGYNVPKSTPSGKKYLEIEKIFLNEAKERQITPKELDTLVWQKYSNNKYVHIPNKKLN